MEVKVKFNDINVKEEKEKTLVKILMLKGEKGDSVSAEWGTITGTLNAQTDLKNALDSKANKSETEQALSQKANSSDLNNYYNKSQIDTALGSKLGTEDIEDNLDSTSSEKVLSAKQGKILKSLTDQKPYYFDTVALMKAGNLSSGDYVITKGYYSANDGGGANYYITNSSSASEYQEELENGLYARLIVEDVINVKQIGIMNNKNNSTILNNFIQNYPEYNIYFPKDYYYFTEPISMNRGITIFGDFENNYGLPSTYQTASLHFAKSGFINCDKNSFRNLSIYGSSRNESNFYCGFKRKAPEGNACSIENCNISNFHAGVYGDTKSVLVSSSIISDCDIGILDFTDGRVINNTITRCYDGIRNTDQGDDTISQNRIEWCTRYGMFITRGRHYIITDNLIDRCSRQGLRAENVQLINVIGNYFRRNYAADSSAGNNHSHVILTDCIDINFNSNNGSSEHVEDGNTGEITPYNGIYLFHNKNINLVGNNFANVVSKPYVFGSNYSDVNIDDYTLNYTQQHTSVTSNNSSEVLLPIYYNMGDAQMPFGYKLIVETRKTVDVLSAKVEEFIIYQASEYLLNNSLSSNNVNISLALDRTNGFITATLTTQDSGTYAVGLKLKPITYPETSNYKFYNHLS